MLSYKNIRGTGSAIFLLGMAAAAVYVECHALPILADTPGEIVQGDLAPSQPSGDDSILPALDLAEFLPGQVPATATVRQMLDFGEFDNGDRARQRRTGPSSTSGNRRSEPNRGSGEETARALNPAFRSLINIGPDQAIAAGLERDRRRRSGSSAEPDIVWAAEDQIKNTLINAVGEGVLSLSLAGIADLRVTLGGDRRPVNVNGIELFSLMRYDTEASRETPAAQTGPPGAASNAQVQQVPATRYTPDASTPVNYVRMLLDFVTEPAAIMAALGLFMTWKLLEWAITARESSKARRRSRKSRWPVSPASVPVTRTRRRRRQRHARPADAARLPS